MALASVWRQHHVLNFQGMLTAVFTAPFPQYYCFTLHQASASSKGQKLDKLMDELDFMSWNIVQLVLAS